MYTNFNSGHIYKLENGFDGTVLETKIKVYDDREKILDKKDFITLISNAVNMHLETK